ncbi:hydrolase [Polynucleobacter sp. SHI8]|uniref:amidohydrolase family protein n=1 Tax=unclassified Polynucleobacter TaxID=2640945 RepID=UPI002492363B|nr:MULTISPECIES: amidohydrolase family protein [unclassified Polynucleobacter]BDW10655.1 hydrolase [Polynucleobacter sp. SHI2]BDW13101.1 hydrolase [Polynucleobacter sp. SHI8]
MLSIQEQEAITFEMPRGACDCHTHVFGPEGQFPYWSERAYTPADASITQLQQLQHQLGIERVVVVHPSPYGVDNTRTLQAIRELGSQARGVAVIDESTATIQEIEKLHQAGFRGARLNLETSGVEDPLFAKNKLVQTAQLIQSFGWHIQIYSNPQLVTQLSHEIMHCAVPVVLDHFARTSIDAGLDQPFILQLFEMLKSGNVWMKLSAPQRITDDPDSDQMAEFVNQLIGANQDRLVWGSDWPHSGAQPGKKRIKEEVEPFHLINDGHALNRLNQWVKDSTILKKILSDNPAQLYDFEKL